MLFGTILIVHVYSVLLLSNAVVLPGEDLPSNESFGIPEKSVVASVNLEMITNKYSTQLSGGITT
jgi:hypothetical protein